MTPNTRFPDPVPPPPTPPTVLTCRNAADLIAALPRLTGFVAEDSVFLVLFDGTRVRCAMRVDLPCSDDPKHWVPLLDLVGRVALRSRHTAGGTATAPAIVITTRHSFRDAAGPPWRELAVALSRRLRREGVPAREVCCLAADGWASYADPTAPATGWPRALIESSPVSHRSAGLNDPPRLAELGDIPEADERRAHAVLRELDAIKDSGPVPRDTPDFVPCSPAEPHNWIAATGELARPHALVSPEGAAYPASTALFGARANHFGGWFVLALSFALGAERVCRLAQELGPIALLELPGRVPRERGSAGRHRSPAHELLAIELDSLGPPSRLAALRRDLMVAIGSLPRELRPGPLGLAALLWWLGGLQSVCGRLLDTARAIRPHDPTTALAAEITELPVIPEVLVPQRRSA